MFYGDEMKAFIELYSTKKGEISKFLNAYYKINIITDLEWKKEFENPLDLIDILSILIDNQEDYVINTWISLDKNILINVNKYNLDKIIRYLYERYPY